MTHILSIVSNDLRIFFAERSNWVSLVLLPVIFTLVLGWAFSGSDGPPRLRVDVLDLDGSGASADLLQALRRANETLVLCPMDNDADDFCALDDEPLDLARGKARAQNEETEALIVIPAGFGEATAAFEPVQIDLYAAGDPAQPGPVEQTLNAVLQRENGAGLAASVTDAVLASLGESEELSGLVSTVREPFVREVYAQAGALVDARPPTVHFTLNTGDADAVLENGFAQSVPGMGAMYVMFTVLGGIVVLLRERNHWTLQRLATMPVTRSQILGGKVLTYFTLGMIQFFIVFGVGLAVGLDFGRNPLLMLPVMIAFVLCCTAMAFAIAPHVTTEGQAAGISRLLALSLAPLGGAWWPLEIVPDFMRRIGQLTPVAWAMSAFGELMYYNGGLRDILPNIGILLAVAALLFAVGVRSFRYTT